MVARAVALAEILPAKHRLLARGLDHYLNGRADSAATAFRSALTIDPQWEAGWMALGETYKHMLPRDGAGDSIPRLAFESARSHDPSFNPPLIHLAEFAVQRGDLEGARELIDALAASGANEQVTAHLELMYACSTGDLGASGWQSAARVDQRVVLRAATRLAEGGSHLACAEAAFRAMWEDDTLSEAARGGAGQGLQTVLMAEGREEEVRETLAVLESRAPQFGRFYMINEIAGAPFRELSQAYDVSLQTRLGPNLSGASAATVWLLGAWLALSGDSVRLQGFIQSAEAAAVTLPTAEATLTLSALRAHQAALAGRAGEALQRLDDLTPVANWEILEWDPVRPMPAEHLLRARLLFNVGRHAEAIRAASVFDQHGPNIFVAFLPESLRIRRDAALAMDSVALADRFVRRLEALGAGDAGGPGS
jgi:tetratricopeptide (TPR) repeat protein